MIANKPRLVALPVLEALSPLRFIAAFLVVITHTTFYINERSDPLFRIWHFGEVGVPIFFVISGLVMVWSSSTIPSNATGAANFAIKRAIRILPLYWLATGLKIAATILSPSVVNHNHFEILYALKSLFFIPAFNGAGEVRPIHGVGWTLLHEVFFYALFSLALLFRCRPALTLSILIPVLYVVGLFYSPHSAAFEVATSAYNLYFVVGMMIGCVLRDKFQFSRHLLYSFLLVVFYLSLNGVLPLDPAAIVVAILILATADIPRMAFLQPFARLGDSSYALYLFHPFISPLIVVVLSRFLFKNNPEIILIFAVFVTIFVCHAIHLIIEAPVTKLLKNMHSGPGKKSGFSV